MQIHIELLLRHDLLYEILLCSCPTITFSLPSTTISAAISTTSTSTRSRSAVELPTKHDVDPERWLTEVRVIFASFERGERILQVAVDLERFVTEHIVVVNFLILVEPKRRVNEDVI